VSELAAHIEALRILGQRYGHLSVKIRPIGAGYWTHCAAMALAARGVDGVIE
jgi:hypothetical protein